VSKTKRKKSTFERLHSGSLNRQQRKELERRFNAAEPDLEIVHPHAAGIDIGNASHFVAVSPSRDSQPVQEFGSWTADLKRMARWLQQCGITTVAMQSTGVYSVSLPPTVSSARCQYRFNDCERAAIMTKRKWEYNIRSPGSGSTRFDKRIRR